MASYHIPQFLDSGDKILGPLNMRQFGYALGGFMICTLIFNLTQALVPGIGNYAIIPCIPLAALSGYLALGKYNGRDSEIYILKFIIFNSKPKTMVYARVPDIADLGSRAAEWTYEAISKRWKVAVEKELARQQNDALTFNERDAIEKAKKIREIGGSIDLSLTNTLTEVQRRQVDIQRKEQLLKAISQKRR